MLLLCKYIKCLLVILITILIFETSSALSKPQLESISWHFYGTSLNSKKTYALNDLESVINHTNFDKTRKTVFYIHDYKDTSSSQNTETIINSYATREDHNIIVLDWAKLNTGTYLFTVPDALELSSYCADAFVGLIKNGLDPEKIHIVGFGLGAHMAGAIGRVITQRNGFKLNRITGLDPTLAAFFDNAANTYLGSTNAQFVDIIHTDAFLMGQGISSGDIDFWPNGGQGLQPGCLPRINQPYSNNDLCSHRRAVEYWAESVSNSNRNNFLAVTSADWQNFQNLSNDKKTVQKMGIDCDTTLGGNYFLQTNSKSPYARGHDGIRYSEIL